MRKEEENENDLKEWKEMKGKNERRKGKKEYQLENPVRPTCRVHVPSTTRRGHPPLLSMKHSTITKVSLLS